MGANLFLTTNLFHVVKTDCRSCAYTRAKNPNPKCEHVFHGRYGKREWGRHPKLTCQRMRRLDWDFLVHQSQPFIINFLMVGERERVYPGGLGIRTRIFSIWIVSCCYPIIFSFAVFLCIPESYLGSLFATFAYILIIFFGSFGSILSGRHLTPLAFLAVWLGSFSCSFSNTAFGIPFHS